MATYVWCELVCEYCSDAICGEFTTGQTIPRKALKAEAISKGAVFDSDDAFCCEDHRKCAKGRTTTEQST